MAPPPTVVALKQRFLGTQTRALSQPLAPSRAWRTSPAQADPDINENETGGGSNSRLPDKAVDDALFRLNHALQQHVRRVYAPQATRHVAEQIDGLYWNAAGEVLDGGAEGEGEGEGDGGGSVAVGLGVGADLAAHETIITLPLSWDDAAPPRHARETAAYPSEAERYSELATQLQTLDGERQRALARVARLRRLHTLLQPFATSTPSGSDDGDGGDGGAVQDNLVTRNGDVEAELQRMRMLLARVGGRVGQLATVPASVPEPTTTATTSDGDDDAMDVDVDVDEGSTAEQQRRVGMLLDRF